jgi:hypothetical protein
MSKNSSKNPSNCIIVSKGGSLKEIHLAESEMNRTKYAALCKTPPTYEGAFKRHTTWNVKKYGIIVELWARANGRAGQENKYDFPPPVDETLFFGDCVLVSIAQSHPLTCSVWKKAYAHLFGGFDDLEKLAEQDDAELDELEHVPNKKKTKHGYLKDGFIIDDAPRTKRSMTMTMTTNPRPMKLITAGDALSHNTAVECKNICDKTVAELIRRGHTYKHKIKDTDCLDDHENDVDEDEDDVDEDEDEDEDDVDEDEDDVDEDDEDNDEDEDEDEHENEGEDDTDPDTEVDVDTDHVTGVKDEERVHDIKIKPKQHVTAASDFTPTPTATPVPRTPQTQGRAQPIAISNKKRAGGRVNNGKKRGATTELVKCDNACSANVTNAAFTHDKRVNQTNLDSELEEESYV